MSFLALNRSRIPRMLPIPNAVYRNRVDELNFEGVSRQRTLNSEQSIGHLLALHGVEYMEFNDLDFLELDDTLMIFFDFLTETEFDKLISAYTGYEIGRIFAALAEIYNKACGSPKALSEVGIEWEEVTWHHKARRVRQGQFKNLLRMIEKSPGAPVELLIDLMV